MGATPWSIDGSAAIVAGDHADGLIGHAVEGDATQQSATQFGSVPDVRAMPLTLPVVGTCCDDDPPGGEKTTEKDAATPAPPPALGTTMLISLTPSLNPAVMFA